MKKIKRVTLLIETSRAFGRDLLKGIARYSKIHGPWSFFRETRGLKSAIPHLKRWEADGIIMRNTPISSKLLDFKLPVITVLHYQKKDSQIPIVQTDSKAISELAAQHLLEACKVAEIRVLEEVAIIGVYTTGSSSLPVDSNGSPLCYNEKFKNNPAAMVCLWKDHTSYEEAADITKKAAKMRTEYFEKIGGVYSSKWHWSYY